MNRPEGIGVNPEYNKFSEIKEKLMEPFSSEELDSVWKAIVSKDAFSMPSQKVLLHRSYNRYDYVIYLHNKEDGLIQIEMQITDPEKQKIANVIFMRDAKYDSSGEWMLSHRLVHTGELGISGTEFLKQSETYMKNLADKKYIDLTHIGAATSQPDVIRWLQKNNYDFVSPQNKKWHEEYLNYPEEFEEVYLSDTSGKDRISHYENEPFVFKKDGMDKDRMSYSLDRNFSDGKHYIISHEDMLHLPGLFRIDMLKKI